MKSTELRIGNLISYTGNFQKIYPCEIELIYMNSDDDKDEIDKYKPIPLTEEWLLKFGFEFDSDEDWYILDCENGVSFAHVLNGCTYYFGNLECLWVDVLQEIRYVHQLQNLYFYLTGEELIK